MDEIISFGDWVRRQRKALDLTQATLAQQVGCAVVTIKKIEQEERRPSRQMAGLLADCLAIPDSERDKFIRLGRGQFVVSLPSVSVPSPPSLSQRKTPYNNLPAQVTPLLGREADLAEIAISLADPTCRLLTLVGPGGIGKTRLAVASAAGQSEAYKHGLVFVSLASLSSADLLVMALADALDLTFFDQTDPQVQLLDHLKDKNLLLVLDNFEHLLTTPLLQDSIEATDEAANKATAIITTILQQAPTVDMLVTSRERLRLPEEWVYKVRGLSIPPQQVPKEIETYGAVKLFLYRARQIQQHVGWPSVEREAIARICQLVDGIPLGIELAAAWVSTLSPVEIADEIERSLDFLDTSLRDLPERRRSMRAVFDHSWQLLTEPERCLFRRLSIFRGGFTREAAESLCTNEELIANSASAEASPSILHVLSVLVDKSFIRRNISGRYEIHELLRQYGREKLEENSADEGETRKRHCQYYLNFLANHEASLKNQNQQTVLETISLETENVREAWAWATQHRRADLIGVAAEALWLVNEVRGRVHRSEAAFRTAVAALEQGTNHTPHQRLTLGKSLICQGGCHVRLGTYEYGTQLLNHGIAKLRSLDAQRDVALGLNFLAAILYLQGEYRQEQQVLQESLALSQAAGDQWLTVYSLNDLGMITHLLGDTVEAQRLSQKALAISRQIGDQRGMAFALSNLGVFALDLGEPEQAEQLYREGLALWRACGHQWGIASTLTHLGIIARTKGDYHESRINLQEAIQTGMRVRARPVVLDALVELAILLIDEGETGQAEEILQMMLRHPALAKPAQEKAEQHLATLRGVANPFPTTRLTEDEAAQALDTLFESVLDDG